MSSDDSELHKYIHSVLDGGEQGPPRLIEFEISDLNDILERHSEKIG